MRQYQRIELYVSGGEAVEDTARRAIREALDNPGTWIDFEHNGGKVSVRDVELLTPILRQWDDSRSGRR